MATKYNVTFRAVEDEMIRNAKAIMDRVGGKHLAWYHASAACSWQALADTQASVGLAPQARHSRLMAEEELAAAQLCASARSAR